MIPLRGVQSTVFIPRFEVFSKAFIPLLVLVVELVADQLGVDLDPQVAGEGNGEEKPQPETRLST